MPDMNWGQIAEGFQLSASFDQERFVVGRPVVLTLAFRNTTDKPRRTVSTSKWTDYRFDLKGKDGAKVPHTLFGSRISDDAGGGRNAQVEVPPGGIIVDEVLLSRMFDLTLAGAYELRVERGIRKASGDGFAVVSSNPAKVLIDEEN